MTDQSAPSTHRLMGKYAPRHTGHWVVVGRPHIDGVEESSTAAVTVTK